MLSYNRTSFLGTDGRTSTDSNPDPIWTEPGLVLLNALVFAKSFTLRSSLPLIDENWSSVTRSALG